MLLPSWPAPHGPRESRLLRQQFVQVQVEGAEFAAIVSRGDAHHTRPASRSDSDPRGLFNAGQVYPVDDNLVDRPDFLGKSTWHQAAQGGTVGIVGTGSELLVTAAHLAPRADNAAGKRSDYPGDRLGGGNGCCGGARGPPLFLPQDKEFPPRHSLDGAKEVLAQELPIHDGQAPVAPAFKLLAELKGVAKET